MYHWTESLLLPDMTEASTHPMHHSSARPVSRLTLVPGVQQPDDGAAAQRVPLSMRERKVLALVATGCSTREVALRMNYSERTIKNVLQTISERLHYRNRTQAVACAVRNGWI